jgi:integrase
MAFRHALRVSELVDIRWEQISLDTATIHIRRAKKLSFPDPCSHASARRWLCSGGSWDRYRTLQA